MTSVSSSGIGSLRIPGDVAAADEAGDARRVADDEPGLGVEDHLHEHVARVDLPLHGVSLALADLDLVLHRDEDLEDLVLHAHRLDAVLEVRLDLVLVARVRVDHVPALLQGVRVAVSCSVTRPPPRRPGSAR